MTRPPEISELRRNPSGGEEPIEPTNVLLRFVRSLDRRSPLEVLLAGILLIVVLGVVDAVTPEELRFFVFYWPPIALVAWVAGWRYGLVAVAVSGLTWFLALLPLEGPGEVPHVVVWNLAANVISFAVLARGIAFIREASDRQRTMALTDFMTGVPNARAFLAALAGEIGRCRRHGTSLSLAYVDVDDFKRINDTLGHQEGNELLRAIAQTIRTSLRASDVVARVGGDEFAMLLPESDAEAARGTTERVLARLAEEVGRRRTPVTFSIGIVTCARLDCTEGEMLQRADALMYEVKREGKNGFRVLTMGSSC